MSESSFNDSSDGEDDSDDPSLVLEDVEGSSDEDIFASKNKNRTELRAKLKKFRKEIPKKRRFQDFSVNDDDNAGWYSDPGEDSDFENVPDEAGDAKKHCYYKDTTKTKDLELVVGMKFASGKIFREVLRDWCVRHGYDLEFIRNETKRITAKCKKGCNWRIHASPIQNEQTFQIKSLKGEHNCARTYVNSLAQSKYLAKRMEGAIRDNPNIGIAQLKNTIMRKCRVDVSKSKIKRAKREALDAIRGLMLYSTTCYGIIVKLSELTIQGFVEGCRPIIGLDGCFLKTVFGGQMLVAVGRDANDNMWPIALAIVQVENRRTGVGLLGRSSTANKQEFHIYMKRIAEIDPKIASDVETANEWLSKIPPQHWCRAFFSVTSKCDILVNNLCESFNNYILEARDKPIISMLEWIRTRLMTRLQTKKKGMEKFSGDVCPNVMKKINKQGKLARHCYSRWCGANEFEVDHFLDKYVVDLDKKTCTCGMFQLNAYPCCHAYAAIADRRDPVEVGAHEEMSSASGPPNTQEDAVPSTQSSMSRNKHNVSTGANVTPTPCTVQISSKKQNLPTTAEKVTPTVCSSQTATAKVQNDGRIYQSPRNAILMGTTQTKFAPSTIEVGGSSSTLGAGLRKPTRQKKPTISQVLQNIREKSKRRPWKP
ncbi:UNVERIFIED_CONTAM: hypothetical protein Sangu_1553800 [Sesamum angustifolium]|uniref:SWIM-type domain-containing protein n=1 Tax=Sesamum angustifolium TaxID=2727405 RepID=A0AAW2MSE1_9LAMI